MGIVIKYDPEADILTVKLREGVIRDERLLDCDVVLGFDEKGELVASGGLGRILRGELLKTLKDLANEKRDVVKALLKKKT